VVSAPTDLLAGFPVTWQGPLVWGDMDALGHLNNTVYFRYFESARIEYLRRIEFLGPPAGQDLGPILASTHCRFRRALAFPDNVVVGARVPQVDEDRFTMEYRVVSQTLGDIAAEGEGVVVSFDYRAGRRVPLPADVRARIAALAPGG
jgi:acyl-CoA thioester hydrolase